MHDASANVPAIPDYFAPGVSTRDDLWRNLSDEDRQAVLAQGPPIARQPTAQTATGIRMVGPPDVSKLIGLQEIKASLNNDAGLKQRIDSMVAHLGHVPQVPRDIFNELCVDPAAAETGARQCCISVLHFKLSFACTLCLRTRLHAQLCRNELHDAGCAAQRW